MTSLFYVFELEGTHKTHESPDTDAVVFLVPISCVWCVSWLNFSSPDELVEVLVRGHMKLERFALQFESYAARVQRVVLKDELRTLFIGESSFHQGEVTILVVTVQFVADNGVADVGEVNADLMFASAPRSDV